MLKKRIIPIELLDNGKLVKTRTFRHPRIVGHPVKSSQVYSAQDADELLLLSVQKNHSQFSDLHSTVSEIAKQCFVPLTIGGGIVSYDQAALLFEAGADKVVLNTVMHNDAKVARQIASAFGTQAVVAGIDIRIIADIYYVYSHCGEVQHDIALEQHIINVQEAGAGEIMLQSIDRDGTMSGYDLQLLSRVRAATNAPIIACGGAGNFMHLKEVFDIGIDAAACGSLFNFGDNNPLRAKAFLKNYNIPLKVIR